MTLRRIQFLLAVVVVFVLLGSGCGHKENKEGFVEVKIEDLVKVKLVANAGGGPMPVVAPIPGKCDVNPRTIQLNKPAAGAAIQWQSTTGVEYNITFQPYQDPSNPDSPVADTYDIPASGLSLSPPLVVSQKAQDNCTNSGACLYPYTVTFPHAGVCALQGSAFGIIVKP